MNKIIFTPYASPMSEVVEINSLEVLCTSNLGGSTEDVGDLDDIFGGNN